MMRLPEFTYHAPRTLAEAAARLAAAPGDTLLLAGGTDLLPNMKRRQQVPKAIVGLRHVAELQQIRGTGALQIGAGVTLTRVVRDPAVRAHYPGLWQAAAQIATPHLRNMGTIGGNLCLDTRCTYYDQGHEWRKAIDFCLKKDGQVCWVAPSSPRCLAVSSTDTAPALLALGAKVRLVSTAGERVIDVADLYRNDGIAYLTRRPDEILTDVLLPDAAGWRSTYWKLRRRGSFDFPVLSVAAAVRLDAGGRVAEARLVLGAVASQPLTAARAAGALQGRPLDDDAIAEAADLAAALAKPMDNTDFTLVWRKRASREFVAYALRELRGDDMRNVRLQVARQSLDHVA
ncbi:MAG TPA: FAD binding domain-containing protein [Vicinamibacterales bacterium]|nr:FAD binding domain-containing protein [Vicinamibacterales bacterium]